MGLQVGYFHSEPTELWPLIYVQNAFLVNILRMNRRISIKFCICIAQTLVSERSGMELQVG